MRAAALPAPRTIVRPSGLGGNRPSNFPSGKDASRAALNKACKTALLSWPAAYCSAFAWLAW